MTAEDKKSVKKFKGVLFTVAIVFLLLAFVIGAVSIYQNVHQEKIYTTVSVGDVKLAKMSIEEASEVLQTSFRQTYKDGFTFYYGDQEVTILNNYEVIQGVERSILEVDFEKTAQNAFWVGRSGKIFVDLKDQLLTFLGAKKIKPEIKFDKEYLKQQLIENFQQFEDRAESAKIEVKITSEKDRQAELRIIDEKDGVAFDYDNFINQLAELINKFNNEKISMELKAEAPQIRAFETEQALAKADEIIKNIDSLTFKYEDNSWQAKWSEYALWLALDKKDNAVGLTFDQDLFYKFLEQIEDDVNIPAKNARFEIVEGKVSEFQVSENGIAINRDKTYEKLVDNFFNFHSTELEIVVEEELPEVTSENINDMGVRELIGVGESNFAGSPANRRHNIRVGSNVLHGLLIEPGEEFSLTKTLGHIDASTGYLAELVIKGNKTIPEYGGGLCQVGTTMFRAAINTGLPVTERKPHSYRVSYYEPAGFDATIYDPSPDVKFINDTGHYVLIQTYINGNILRFEFWGTDDGREVDVTYPTIFNITYPGPTKEIVSEDLEPGQRRCTERAHNGADAVFYRTITTASGDVNEETWSSTYRPWQAVCLVGPEAPAEDGDGGDTEAPPSEPAPAE